MDGLVSYTRMKMQAKRTCKACRVLSVRDHDDLIVYI